MGGNFVITENELTLTCMVIGCVGMFFFLTFIRQMLFRGTASDESNLETVTAKFVGSIKALLDFDPDITELNLDLKKRNNYVYKWGSETKIYSEPAGAEEAPLAKDILVCPNGEVFVEGDEDNGRVFKLGALATLVGAVTVFLIIFVSLIGQGYLA